MDDDKITLCFHGDGRFKIVQFTDIHWVEGAPSGAWVLNIMGSVLDAEKPDLVILTGDISTTTPAAQGWKSVLQPLWDRNLPWAAVVGNHDTEHDLGRAEIVSLLEGLPGSLVCAGPAGIGGYGNYVLTVKDATRNHDVAVLYCLDSHDYTPIPGVGTYGWIRHGQVAWYREQSRRITEANQGQPLPGLAFFHIPLPEYLEVWTRPACRFIGTKEDGICAPDLNTGLFAAMVESRDVMGVFVGHDHDNDYAGHLHGICLAYGRVGGFETYGKLTRGARVIELSEGRRTFRSWIRNGEGEIAHAFQYPDSFAAPPA